MAVIKTSLTPYGVQRYLAPKRPWTSSEWRERSTDAARGDVKDQRAVIITVPISSTRMILAFISVEVF